jgi:hypothetical protein
MSGNEDTVEILPENGKNIAKDDTIYVRADGDAKNRTLDPDEGINDLKMKLEQERNGRIEAERYARQAAEVAVHAKNEVQDTNLQLVRNAIDTVKRNNDILKYNYSEAMSVGDYTKAAEIQENMGINSAKLMELERGRSHMENAPKIVAPEPPRPSDPVEALASQLSPRSADWVRRNPQCVTDPRMYQKMVAAHNFAVADGYTPDSDEYFGLIEDTLRISKRVSIDHDDDPMSGSAKVTQRRSAPPAAPVSRGGGGTGSRPNEVRLTREEIETARDLGMTEKDYARNKMLLKKEGRMQ